jgi:mono/diheme cytochrome c family protein
LLERTPDRQGLSRSVLALAFALLTAAPAEAADPHGVAPPRRYQGAELDWTLRCGGCHGIRGQGTPGHVPRLAGFVGHFTRHPEGRDYLMRVPGVVRARLDDARLAAVLNWLLASLSGEEVAAGFAPFTPGEVARARRAPLPAPQATRARLIADLRSMGVVAADEDGLGRSPEQRRQAGP